MKNIPTEQPILPRPRGVPWRPWRPWRSSRTSSCANVTAGGFCLVACPEMYDGLETCLGRSKELYLQLSVDYCIAIKLYIYIYCIYTVYILYIYSLYSLYRLYRLYRLYSLYSYSH